MSDFHTANRYRGWDSPPNGGRARETALGEEAMAKEFGKSVPRSMILVEFHFLEDNHYPASSSWFS
jgi:hypothetical protein